MILSFNNSAELSFVCAVKDNSILGKAMAIITNEATSLQVFDQPLGKQPFKLKNLTAHLKNFLWSGWIVIPPVSGLIKSKNKSGSPNLYVSIRGRLYLHPLI